MALNQPLIENNNESHYNYEFGKGFDFASYDEDDTQGRLTKEEFNTIE
jgi:hypothetical protein